MGEGLWKGFVIRRLEGKDMGVVGFGWEGEGDGCGEEGGMIIIFFIFLDFFIIMKWMNLMMVFMKRKMNFK